METTRRNFLAIAATLWRQAALAAQRHVHNAPAPQNAPPRKPAFFTEAESELVARLAARIIPADERSGGAVAARLHEYIDFILSHGPGELQNLWRDGLERLAPRLARTPGPEIDVLLMELSRNEFAPSTPDEEFFVVLKSAVVEGFYTSEEGIRKELGYAGNTYVREFPGCRHQKHEPPADYRALLRSRG